MCYAYWNHQSCIICGLSFKIKFIKCLRMSAHTYLLMGLDLDSFMEVKEQWKSKNYKQLNSKKNYLSLPLYTCVPTRNPNEGIKNYNDICYHNFIRIPIIKRHQVNPGRWLEIVFFRASRLLRERENTENGKGKRIRELNF